MAPINDRSNAARLVPIKGLCYVPAPSDDQPSPPQKYFDTDFTNDCFPLIWGNGQGRGDLATIANDLHVNLLHLYDWSVPPTPGNVPDYKRNHIPFLDACRDAGLRVMVPISNYFVGLVAQGDPDVAGQIHAMVSEIYGSGKTPHAAAGLWSIGNEYDLLPGTGTRDGLEQAAGIIAKTAAYLVQAEDELHIPDDQRLPITSPVSFALHYITDPNQPGIAAVRALQSAFQKNSTVSAVWDTRFIAALNTFSAGDFLENYIKTTFPRQDNFPNLPFFLSEMGMQCGNGDPCTAQEEEAQANFVATQLLAVTKQRGNFMGTCVFQFLNQSALKTGTEATFGLTKYAGSQQTQGTIPPGYTPGGGETYPVDTLTHKPLFNTVAIAYQ
jgi:hypothetical protein